MAELPRAGIGPDGVEPAFASPWHAQLFAITLHLRDAEVFTWTEWTTQFGAGLARHGLSKELDGGDDYFLVWLETLEAMLSRLGLTQAQELRALRDAWTQAYLSTPHGHPVRLGS